LLRRLAATAPDPDSDVVFLPQPRAVNFVKACQGWIASDEDIDEDVESEITDVFFHLVPILQNVPGSHWDFIFDLIENNLEVCWFFSYSQGATEALYTQNASFEDDTTLTILWRTIGLIQVIQDQVLYNKALRADWKKRETAVLTLLRDILASEPGMWNARSSMPFSVLHPSQGLYPRQSLELYAARRPYPSCRTYPRPWWITPLCPRQAFLCHSYTLQADHCAGHRIDVASSA
jgi:hypothetical protein